MCVRRTSGQNTINCMHAEIAGFTEKLIIDHACKALDHSNAGCIVAFNVITGKFADLNLIGLSIREEAVCAHDCSHTDYRVKLIYLHNSRIRTSHQGVL